MLPDHPIDVMILATDLGSIGLLQLKGEEET